MRVKHLCVVLFTAALVGLGGCNTVEGLGRDVQSVGKTVERTAQ